MKLAMWYWIFLVLSVLGGFWWHLSPTTPPVPPYLVHVNSLLLLLLLIILGYAVFQGPVTG